MSKPPQFHFVRFSLALTLLFVVGIICLYVINGNDNRVTGQSKRLPERIKEVMGN